MKNKIIFLIANILTLCFEIFAKGAVCIFATPEKTIPEYFSYFSLTPYGYANFGPFITAVLTCVLFIFAVMTFTPLSAKIRKAVKIVSLISVITSFLPLIMFGVRYFNIYSCIISVLLIVQFIITLLKGETKNEIC